MNAPTAPKEDALVTTTRGAVARALAAGAVPQATPMADHLLQLKEVRSGEECQALVDAAKLCKIAHKEIDDQRKSITGPLKKATDAANSMANPLLVKFKAAMDHAKRLYDAWKAKESAAEAERVAAAALLEQQSHQRDVAAVTELVEAGAQDVDMPPEAAVYAPPATTQVKGGLGAMHQSSRKAYRVIEGRLAVAVAAHPYLFDIKLRQNDTKAALEAARRYNPDATLEGIEEYDAVSTNLV